LSGATEFEKRGTAYVLYVPALQTTLTIRHLGRRGGDLHGMLSVRTGIPGAKTYEDGLLVDGVGINLNSWTAHKTTAQRLEERAPTDNRVDWQGLVSELCMRTTAAEDQGEDMDEVGDLPITLLHERWVIDPLVIRDGVSLLYGAGDSGKSYLAYAMALSVELGREIIPGCPPALKGRTVYLDWETNNRTANDRIHQLKLGCGIEAGRLIYRRMRRPLYSVADETAEAISRVGATFVVIDSAERAMGAKSEYSDLTDAAMRLYEAIDLMGHVSVLVIDHVAKSDLAGGGGNGPIGAVAKHNAARLSYRVTSRQTAGALEIVLRQHKHNDLPVMPDLGLRLRIDPGGPATFEALEQVPIEPEQEQTAAGLPTRTFRALSSLMRRSGNHGDGWALIELTKGIGHTSDGRVRAELKRDDWRRSPDGAYEERIICVHEGGAGRGNSARYALETRMLGLAFTDAPGMNDGGPVQ
jgi:AAA domain